jgi:hypothetical protein
MGNANFIRGSFRCNPRFKFPITEWLVVWMHFIIAGGVAVVCACGIIGMLINNQLRLATAPGEDASLRTRIRRVTAAVTKSDSSKLCVLAVMVMLFLLITICT